MKRPLIQPTGQTCFVFGFIAAGLWFHVAGCNRDTPRVQARRPVVVVISGDTAGWITPCGCTSNQSGGLLRRGTYLAALSQRADVVYADAGGAAAGLASGEGPGGAEYQKVKFEAIVTGEMKSGLSAHNLGASEAALGAAYLREFATRSGAPFVSANLCAADGRLLVEPIRFTSAGGRRVAMVGVISPRLAGTGMHANDPRQSILSAIAGAKGRFDLLIVLAYLPQEELEQLSATLPEADAIIGGPTGQPIQPRNVGPTLIASATNKGKFLVELELPALPGADTAATTGSASARWIGRIVEMDTTLHDNAEQQAVLRDYLAELGRRDFSADQTGLGAALPPDTPAGYRIAGTAACATCHAAEQAIWGQSKHAHAWQTLTEKRFDVDPSCMQCHTTGYGLPGGFVSRGRSPSRVAVGCEDCHGPSQAHANNPRQHTPYLAADRCTSCHDHENSPRFEFNTFWSQIRHGDKTASEPTTRKAQEVNENR